MIGARPKFQTPSETMIAEGTILPVIALS